MANPRPVNNGWEDKKRPLHRVETSITKKPRLDVRVLSSRNPTSPRKDTSPKGFRRSVSMPNTSRDSPSPTDELVLSAVIAAEVADREAQKANQISKSAPRNLDEPGTSKAAGKPLAKPPNGNNGSSGFEKLFSEEIDEAVVEELLLAASQVEPATSSASIAPSTSRATPTSRPPPLPMSQAYDFFSKGVKAHSSILEPDNLDTTRIKAPSALRPSNAPPSAFRVPQTTPQGPSKLAPNQLPGPSQVPTNASSSTINKMGQNRINHPSASRMAVIPEEKRSAPGAEAEIRRLELELDRLNVEIKTMKEAQNTKDGEAAMLRFQVNEIRNNLMQQKASHAQAIDASNNQFNEKLKELQRENDKLRSQLQVQTMEARTARERAKLLETSNARVRLVEPQSPITSSSHNTSIVRSPQKNKRSSAFLNRSTFEEVDQGPISITKTTSKSPLKEKSKEVDDNMKSDLNDQRLRLDVPQKTAGTCLGLRLAGWERVEADDSDDSGCTYSIRRKEFDPALSLDLLKIGSSHDKRRKRILPERDRPGLASCMPTLRTLFKWPEQTLESPAVQSLLRKVLVECCGVIHYKLLLLKDCDESTDERTLYERDADIIERGGNILDLNEEHDLLDDRPWYKGERGISIRRALGLLSELAFASKFVAVLLTGGQSSDQSPLDRHRFTELPDFKDDCLPKVNTVRDRKRPDKGEPMEGVVSGSDTHAGSKEDAQSERPDRFWFLEILADLCATIVKQRRTNQFNGVLVGLCKLLQKCAQNDAIIGEARPIILRIIRSFLQARPSYYALRTFLLLLEQLAKYEDLMGGLCTYADDDESLEDLNYGLCYFKNDSCPLELLCAQLNSAGKSRWHLSDPSVRWLLAVFAQTSTPPRWLVPLGANDGSDGSITCCHHVIGAAIALVYDAFHVLRDSVEREDSAPTASSRGKVPFRKVMQRAILLLHTLAGYDLFRYMDKVEGLYDVLIPGINSILHQLEMAKPLENCFSALVRLEEEANSAACSEQGAEDIDAENIWAYAVRTI